MREFMYYSGKAVTAGNRVGEDLMKAGRMDIVCQFVIMSFFVSHQMREDVKLHLVFDGPPYGNRHLIFKSNKDMPISKKDVAGLIKRMLYKCNEKKITEVFPGCFIEKKSFSGLIKELNAEGKKIYILDKRGDDIRDVKICEGAMFVFGDQEGIPKKELKKIKRMDIKKISVGPKVLFASQALIVLQNELDRMD